MRITYVTHTRFPTEKAHGYQVAQVCHAMAALDHEVTLVTPTVGVAPAESAFRFYGITESFSILRLQQFDALSSSFVPGQLAFAVAMISYRYALKVFPSALRAHDQSVPSGYLPDACDARRAAFVGVRCPKNPRRSRRGGSRAVL